MKLKNMVALLKIMNLCMFFYFQIVLNIKNNTFITSKVGKTIFYSDKQKKTVYYF